MTKAEELLNSLDETDESLYPEVVEEEPEEPVRMAALYAATATESDEPRVIIFDDRSMYVPDSIKKIGVQFDHDVNLIRFDCPRYSDGVDLYPMQFYVNYIRPDGTPGAYHVEDVTIDENNSAVLHFSWHVLRHATEYQGNLTILVCVKETDDSGNLEHHWNTELNSDFYLSEGLVCDDVILAEYQDIITQLLTEMDVVKAIATPEAMQGYTNAWLNQYGAETVRGVEQKGQEVLASIPEDYTQLSNDVNELKSDLANITEIKKKASENIFNENAEHISNSYVKHGYSDNGSIESNQSHDVYYVPIENGKTYTFLADYVLYGDSLSRVCCVYDENKQFSKRIVGTYDTTNHTTTFTVDDANAKYLGLTVSKVYKSITMMVEGSVYPNEYIPFSEEKKGLNSNIGVYRTNLSKEVIDFIEGSDYNITETKNVNIFDISTITKGKILDKNGNITDKSQFAISDFIPIESGETYCVPIYTKYFGATSGIFVCCYDEEKNYVRYVGGTLDSNNILTFSPVGSYIRVIVNSFDKSYNQSPYHIAYNFMVTKAPYPTDKYYTFGRNETITVGIEDGEHEGLNPLYGKSVEFLGDSICEGGGADVVSSSEVSDKMSGWAGRIGLKNKMLWVNNGLGGSTIAITSSGKTICNKPLMLSNPDYIIFEGGTNDADRIGSILNGATPSAFGVFDADNYGTNDAENNYGFDINTFCGAFDYICRRLTSEYAGKKIGYIIPQKMGQSNGYTKDNNNRRAYFEYAIKFCEKWGVPYLNLWDGCYLYPKNPSHYTSGSEASLYADGQHLNGKGYDYITPMIEAWMKTL